MPADRKITLDVLGGYLKCPYLARLLLAGQEGIKSDYEIVLAELEQAVRLTITERLRSQYPDQSLVTGVAIDRSTLSKGAAFVLDAELRDDSLSIRFDGLKRVDGRSQLGDFHYVPTLFCGNRHIRKPQRLSIRAEGSSLGAAAQRRSS